MMRMDKIPAGASALARRHAGLDHLKVFLTLLVVLHHAGQPYGPTGGAWPISHAEKFALLGPFFHINASFFMGLFFLMSGYFMPAAVDRKGAGPFLVQRLWRFGLPIVLFAVGFVPLARHFTEGRPLAECFLPLQWGHLWFLGHLLLYAGVYAAWRGWRDGRKGPRTSPAETPAGARSDFPGWPWTLGYCLALALASMAIREIYPIDRWVRIGVPAEPAHLPQYVSLFCLGVLGARRRWLERIPRATGRIWLAVALAMVVLRYAVSVLGRHFPGDDAWWFDYAWCQWEALLCVGMCIGLPYAFTTWASRAGAASRFLAENAFAVYVLHLPILVFVQRAMEGSTLGPLALTGLTALVTMLAAYGLATALARLRPRGRVPDQGLKENSTVLSAGAPGGS